MTLRTFIAPLSEVCGSTFYLTQSYILYVRWCNELSQHDQYLEDGLRITTNVFLVSCLQEGNVSDMLAPVEEMYKDNA